MWIKVLRPDAVLVWKDPEVARRLRWYRSVMLDETPAKFMIAKSIKAPNNIDDLGEDDLWKIHDELHEEAEELFEQMFGGGVDHDKLKPAQPSYLDVKIKLARKILKNCRFCEWRCGVDRTAGQKGICGLPDKAYVASFFHHHGEEAPLIGTEGQGGSGTIFFVSCNLHCVFCQNWDISHPKGRLEDAGVEVDSERLALIAKRLRLNGAANINYVGGDPTPNTWIIIESLKHLDVNAPILWNSNMYLSMESMKLLIDLVDIWLPDFKYWSDECAKRLSNVRGKIGYREAVTRNHLLAAKHGDMIIRHLVLPNHLECDTKPILKWIAENVGGKVLVNIMEQYRPEHLVLADPRRYSDVDRRPTREEILEAYRYADELKIVYRPVS